MEATDSQLERIFNLIERFAKMRERSLTDVTLALLNSDTLARYGYDGKSQLTPEQADIAAGILEVWIRKASAL